MIKILFICHGNICRSPMAEFVMKKIVKDAGIEDQFLIESAATSTEEIGNDIYSPAKRKLTEKGIPFTHRGARQIRRADYDRYDYIIAMEKYNLRNMHPFFASDPEKKIHLMLDFTSHPGDVSDPWYTGDFEEAYNDIWAGCTGLFSHITENTHICRD